jgi:hypothetical protein
MIFILKLQDANGRSRFINLANVASTYEITESSIGPGIGLNLVSGSAVEAFRKSAELVREQLDGMAIDLTGEV